MIEPGLTGGRLDGIGMYTGALLRHLPAAGCDVTPWSWPRARGGAAGIGVGQAFPYSFETATLLDLATPSARIELAEAMPTTAQDSVARTRCIAAGRARAEQLTWQNTARLTANVYRAVLSQ